MGEATSFLILISSLLFRFISYTYLRWIPGRQATYTTPILFLISTLPLIKSILTKKKLVKTTTITTTTESSNELTYKSSYSDLQQSEGIDSSDGELPSTPTPTPNRNGRRGEVGTIRRKKGSGTSTPTTASSSLVTEKKEVVQKAPKITTFQMLKSLVLGTKSTSNFINLLSILLNSLIIMAVLDSIFSPIIGMNESDLSFTRIGGINHHSVKLFVRIPPIALTSPVQSSFEEEEDKSFLLELQEEEEFNGVKIEFRPTKPLGKWIKGGNLVVDRNKDWTGVITLDNLWANTEYEYQLLTPTLSHTLHPAFTLQKFTTFPDPSLSQPYSPGSAGTHYTFASSSCIKPGYPYSTPYSKTVLEGVKYLNSEISKSFSLGGAGINGGGPIRFLLFLGDFVYADTPYFPGEWFESTMRYFGLGEGGSSKEQYLKRYRQVFATKEMKEVVEKIPMINIYDDHEFYNDFSSNSTDPYFQPANNAYQAYLGSVNPDPPSSSSTKEVKSKLDSEEKENYYTFQYGDSSFFVMDTRKYRSENDVEDDENKTMLGLKQKSDFLDWAAKVNQTVTWKFVVTSTPMMTLWSLSSDTWAGFLTEREELLDVLEFVPNVIVLSGDRHEFAAASLRNNKVTEFSTSPLSQFYLPIRTLSQFNGLGATGQDVLLKYLPDGNSKFTTFEVDTRITSKPLVRVRVIIDGEEAWKVEVLGKALKAPSIEKTVGSLGLSLLELLGFKKRSWF